MATFSVGGYSGARLSNSEETDARLNTDIGLTGNAGYSWQSGSRSLNAGYSVTTRASAGSWLDLENAEGQLNQQITGATRFAQQARNNLWDLSLGHQATLYNPSQGLTLNPFDLEVRQGLSSGVGLNIQPGARTRLRLGANAGTSLDADFEEQGSTLGWSASATRQLKPRTSGSLQISQTALYSPDEDDPVVINSAQLSLNRALQNGSVSGSVGVSQSDVNDVTSESVTASLARRWQWSQHQGEVSLNRAISNTLLDLTTLAPGSADSGSSAVNSGQGAAASTVQSLSLKDSASLSLSTQRWCDVCTYSLSLSGTRAQRLSESAPGVPDAQYSAVFNAGLVVRVDPRETVNLGYQWQGEGLGPDEQLQQRNQVSAGWKQTLDRRLSVSATTQFQWIEGRGIDDRNEFTVRAAATYQLGSVQ